MTTVANHLDEYEPLDIIGNGSFGIIRKVRRKADGEVRSITKVRGPQITDCLPDSCKKRAQFRAYVGKGQEADCS